MISRSHPQSCEPRGKSSDRGNIVLLSLGVVAVLLGLLALVIDVGHGYARQIAATAAAERIALAGATAIDALATAPPGEPGMRLKLAKAKAVTAMRSTAVDEARQWPGLRLTSAVALTDSVHTNVCAPVRFPVGWRSVGATQGKVCARAAAATAISWRQYP